MSEYTNGDTLFWEIGWHVIVKGSSCISQDSALTLRTSFYERILREECIHLLVVRRGQSVLLWS